MHKNSNQYQSTPQLQKNYYNSGNEQQGYSYQYNNSQQEQQRKEQRQPANPNQYQYSQVNQLNQQQKNNNFTSPSSNQQALNYGQQNFTYNQVQQGQQYTDQDEYAYDYSGQNPQLNHTFSEDSNVENSQVMYPSENKENSSNNQRSKQKAQYQEMERGSHQSQYNNEDGSGQERNSKKKRTLAIITLDVGGGNSDVIQVMEGDDLHILAKNFCIKHNLDDDCIQYIIKNIQAQLEKRKAKKKEKQVDANINNQQQQQPNKNLPTTNSSISSKDNNFRKSSESPKFPGLQQSQQGSLQNNFNLNQQVQKQSGGFNQKHFNHQAILEEENTRKKRPQQPSFGQNQFFDQNSPQKNKVVYDQINEEEYEDQSISVIGQSANISMPDENYEYQSTNKYQVKQQSKNQQNQGFEKEQQGVKNNFLSPPQNNKMSAQQFSSPQSTGIGQQYLSSNSTTAAIQNARSPNSTFPNSNMQTGHKKNLNNNSSANSNIYNYQEDQEEFVDDIEDENARNQQQLAQELLEDRQDILDYEEYNPSLKKQGMKINQQFGSKPQQNQQYGANFNQNQVSSQVSTKNVVNPNPRQQQAGNQLYPSQKPPQFSKQEEQDTHNMRDDQGDNYNNQDFEDHEEYEQDQDKLQNYQHEDQEPYQETKKKIIEQISQKLNIEAKRGQPVQQNTQQLAKPQQQQPSQNQANNSHQKQKSKGKGSNLQQQLDAKKEQFFNSYFSQKNQSGSQQNNQRQHEDQDELDNFYAREDPNKHNQASPQQITKHKPTQSKEQQFESPQRHLRKSYSNNNLQQYAATQEVEEKSGAQQSYEQWQKILNQRLVNGQKVNLKVKRVSGNTPTTSTNPVQGKVFSIQNNQPSTPSNQKKSQVFSNNQNIGSNTSISPRTLNKNKSATQLNNIASTSMTNFHQNHHQALSQSQLTAHQKLYIQGMEQMDRRKRMFEDNQEKSKEREVQGSTFHPSISPQSRNMKLQDGVKLEDYLLLEGRKNKERKAIAALVKEEENNQDCKFKPQVSIVSQKLAEHQQSQNDSNYSSIHDRLYFQGISDIASKEDWSNQQFYNIYPFNPDLGVNKDRKVPEKTQKEFTNRLISEKQQKEAKLLVQRQKENEFVDKQTGQKLFHPKINKDEVHMKVSARVDIQDKLLGEELKTRSISPISQKKGREVQPPRIGQLKWDELLRSNRQPDHYEPKKLSDNKGRSVTPRNMKTITSDFEETNYIPLSSRAATNISANQEIENILNQSCMRNKKITIKPSKSKERLQTIPTINLSKKQISTTPNNYYHSSNVNQTKLSKNTSQIINVNNTALNQTNFTTGARSKSQINLNPNQTQLQLSAISQFDNGRVFNDHKLSQKIAKLFDEFDQDGDGKINQLNIDISATEPEILEIIQNVLFEIDEKNLTLNRNQFTQLLCSHNLIIPLKRYYSKREGEVCDEDMTDYDIIRSNISAINQQNNTYIDNTQYNNPNISANIPAYQNQYSHLNQQQYENYYEDQQPQFQQQQQQPSPSMKSNINNNSQIQYQNTSYNNNNNNNLYSNSITNNIINSLNQNNNRNLNLSKKPSKNN